MSAARRMAGRAANMYGGVEPNLDRAISYWKSALLLLGEASPEDTHETVVTRADILVSMAAAHQKQQDFHQAIEFYQEAQDGIEEALGADRAHAHPTYARAVSDQVRLGWRLETSVLLKGKWFVLRGIFLASRCAHVLCGS